MAGVDLQLRDPNGINSHLQVSKEKGKLSIYFVVFNLYLTLLDLPPIPFLNMAVCY